jgi:hypothetical protein
MRGANGYDGQGCSDINGCVPECRYYRPFGRIEDEEIVSWYEEIQQHSCETT